MREAFQHITRREGVRGLFVGSDAQCFRVSFTSGTQLALYDTTKYHLYRNLPSQWQQVVPLLTALSTAVCTSLLAHPLDVILVRVYNQSTHNGQAWYSGSVDAAVKTVKAEGIGGLYKGFGATFFRQVPHTTVTFMSLEFLRNQIESS